MVDYNEMDPSFYEGKASTKNILGNWFHNSRNEIVCNLVKKYYEPGYIIVDLGCGNALWNKDLLPVIGVDVNEKFLDFTRLKNRISEKIVGTIDNTGLADDSADIIIITEVIEHLSDLEKNFAEIYRILKLGGIVISSVPYDTNFSLWKPLFSLQCFYRGSILGEQYYKEKCGHINHFSKKIVAELFIKNKFKILEQKNHFYFTIFTIVEK